jgi:hypothetical protein
MSGPAGLLLALCACASYYEDRCTELGNRPGSPELSSCIQQQMQEDRMNRARHLTYGRGGAGR